MRGGEGVPQRAGRVTSAAVDAPLCGGYIRGSVFRFHPFKGWFRLWFFDSEICPQGQSLLLPVLYYLFLLYVSVW